MPTPPIDTSVVITTCTRRPMLSQMLVTLAPQIEALPFTAELVIVDDGSTDDTAEFLREFRRTAVFPVTIVEGERRGVAAARNRGLAAARGVWIASCDDDQLADRNWITALRAAADAKNASFVGGSMDLHFPEGCDGGRFGLRAQRLLGFSSSEGSLRKYPRGSHPATNNVLMRTSAARGLNGFDLQFVQGGEDKDLFTRAEEAGYELWFEPAARMQHIMTPRRLSEQGLRWTAMRIGAGDSRMEKHLHPLSGLVKLIGKRVAVALLRDLPQLAIAAVRRESTRVLDVRCSLWYTEGLLRSVPSLIIESQEERSSFLEQLDFRRRNGERIA